MSCVVLSFFLSKSSSALVRELGDKTKQKKKKTQSGNEKKSYQTLNQPFKSLSNVDYMQSVEKKNFRESIDIFIFIFNVMSLFPVVSLPSRL